MKKEAGQEICPYTLEACEGCSETEIIENKAVCSFTLEPCAFRRQVVFDRAAYRQPAALLYMRQ